MTPILKAEEGGEGGSRGSGRGATVPASQHRAAAQPVFYSFFSSQIWFGNIVLEAIYSVFMEVHGLNRDVK